MSPPSSYSTYQTGVTAIELAIQSHIKHLERLDTSLPDERQEMLEGHSERLSDRLEYALSSVEHALVHGNISNRLQSQQAVVRATTPMKPIQHYRMLNIFPVAIQPHCAGRHRNQHRPLQRLQRACRREQAGQLCNEDNCLPRNTFPAWDFRRSKSCLKNQITLSLLLSLIYATVVFRDAVVRLAGSLHQSDYNELLLVVLGCYSTLDAGHYQYRAVVGDLAWEADADGNLAGQE
jgi:hypothetical protein